MLKSAVHLFFLRAVATTFPDAHLVQIHREPREAIPSTGSMVAAFRAITSDAVDPVALGQDCVDQVASILERGTSARTFSVRSRGAAGG